MARLIVFNDYLNASKKKAHLMDSLHYISEREGVETNDKNIRYKTPLNPSTAAKSVTEKQDQLIKRLLDDFPDLKDDLIYEHYQKDRNMFSASKFLSDAFEQLEEMALSNEIYMQYISSRPNVDIKDGLTHGLFDITGPADLKAIENELKAKDGNVWRSIISLRRDDAAELDFENQTAWREMLIKHIPKLADSMGIPYHHFRWCAAFHNESYHPHVHMMYWSTDDTEGFCSKQTIHDFKSELVNDIFTNEIWLYKEFKTEKRIELEDEFRKTLDLKINDIIDSGTKAAMKTLPEQIYQDLLKLSNQVNSSGSHFYQYQSADAKEQTDLIVAKVLSNSELAPIVDAYLSSQKDLASFYLKENSSNMAKYMENFCHSFIHPGKGDRKVLHNEIIHTAYEIKSQMFLKHQMEDPFTKQIYNMLDDNISPAYLQSNQLDRYEKAVCRFSMYMNHDPETTLKHMMSFTSEEKAMEILLQLRSGKEDILIKDQFNEADWKVLQHAYLDSIKKDNTYFPPDQTFHCCAKLLQTIINWFSLNTRNTSQEVHRLKTLKREDEFALQKMHFNERKKK